MVVQVPKPNGFFPPLLAPLIPFMQRRAQAGKVMDLFRDLAFWGGRKPHLGRLFTAKD
jgi:hypothetical protein